jgi:hypothetical protein
VQCPKEIPENRCGRYGYSVSGVYERGGCEGCVERVNCGTYWPPCPKCGRRFNDFVGADPPPGQTEHCECTYIDHADKWVRHVAENTPCAKRGCDKLPDPKWRHDATKLYHWCDGFGGHGYTPQEWYDAQQQWIRGNKSAPSSIEVLRKTREEFLLLRSIEIMPGSHVALTLALVEAVLELESFRSHDHEEVEPC